MTQERLVAYLNDAIRHNFSCDAKYRETVEVKEFYGQTPVWGGDVVIFEIEHPDAKVCYAWPVFNDQEKVVGAKTVLGKPPVDTALAAVRAAIVADHRERAKN